MSRDVNGAAKGICRLLLLLLLLLKVSVTTRVGCDVILSGLRREWGLLEAGAAAHVMMTGDPCDMISGLRFQSGDGSRGWGLRREQSGLRRELGGLLLLM
jgi:hypothetical protein